MKTQISVINETTLVSDDDGFRWTRAVQQQISNDFSPAWGGDAVLHFVPRNQKPDPSSWWLALLDDTDQASILGYHDVSDAGLPLGKVFAKTTLAAGDTVSSVLSHELLEMLAAPDCRGGVQLADRFYAKEVCDPCEGDGYGINGVEVSNFVLPSYFQPATGKAPFDFLALMENPCPSLRPGGYCSWYSPDKGWQQSFGDRLDASMRVRLRPHSGSRRQRRAISPRRWELSTVLAR